MTKNSSINTGGAVSSQTIACGNAFVEFTAVGTGNRAAGLSNGNTNVTLEDIDFGIRAWGATASARENGIWQAEVSYVSGDVFKIEVLDGTVLYKKNGITFHSTEDPNITYPLLVDSFLDSSGATVGEAVIFGEPEECSATELDVIWTDLVQATADGNTLIKDSAVATGGAVSAQTINCGNGYGEYTAVGTGNRGAGLSHGNAGVSLEEIDFAVRAWNSTASVYENGVWRAQVGYVSGDVFRVEVANGQVLYKKNGATFHTNTNPNITYPLMLDAFLDSSGATVGDAELFASAGECSETSWPNEPAGMTLHSDWGFDQNLPTSGDVPISGSPGWSVVANAPPNSPDGWAERVLDGGAPFSPSNVYRFVYPAGMVEGTAPATVYTTIDADEVYAGFWWKPSSPLDLGPNGVKLGFMFNGGGGSGGQQFLILRPDQKLWVSIEYPGDGEWRAPNVTSTTVTLGAWHLVEWYANRTTGQLRWWLDGVLQGSHDDAPNAQPFDNFQFSPTWGGGTGAIKQFTDFYWFDHVHVSTR